MPGAQLFPSTHRILQNQKHSAHLGTTHSIALSIVFFLAWTCGMVHESPLLVMPYC